jgi:hypothetical protein
MIDEAGTSYDRLVVAIGEFMGGPQDELDPYTRFQH